MAILIARRRGDALDVDIRVGQHPHRVALARVVEQFLEAHGGVRRRCMLAGV
jgi:hypothetical protein